ncbi:MAG: PRC-barrel domain-containing protein [Candidatus Omnitrophica bacterium]|nr:PRC-barrel domain-containing protein [Candidatus Omnitrophota bacterium]
MKMTSKKVASWLVAAACLGFAPGLLAQSNITAPTTKGQQQQMQTGMKCGAEHAATLNRPSPFDKASDLLGMEVKNPQGQKLGDIRDIVIDWHSNHISYVVMGTGGFLGLEQKMLAVPLKALQPSANQKYLVLNADKASVDNAKGFTKNDWPSVSNSSWGAQPFWKTPAIQGTPKTGTQPATGSSVKHQEGSGW